MYNEVLQLYIQNHLPNDNGTYLRRHFIKIQKVCGVNDSASLYKSISNAKPCFSH